MIAEGCGNRQRSLDSEREGDDQFDENSGPFCGECGGDMWLM